MRVAAYRPRRKIRSEILQLSIAMVIPAIVFDAFPYKALRPVADSAAKDEARPATCAFVSLSPDDERRILAVARSAWHVDAESVRSLRLEMFVDEIPDVALPPVADISVRKRNVRNLPLPDRVDSPPTDMRAAEPGALDGNPRDTAASAAFTREELLNL
jgi:hypothetical protein